MPEGLDFGRLANVGPLRFDSEGRLDADSQRILTQSKPRRLRAQWRVTIAGQDVTDTLDPFLIKCSVVDKEREADVCTIELDDRYGRIMLPNTGDPVHVAMGWPDEGIRTVFQGSVADVESAGQKSSGRILLIEANSLPLLGNIKSQISGSFGDGETKDVPFSEVMQGLAKSFGGSVRVDPELGKIARKHWNIPNVSPMEYIDQMADSIGGVAKWQGNELSITKKDGFNNAQGEALTTVFAVAGQNLMAWRIRPVTSRAVWAKTAHMFWDRQKADMKLHGKDVGSGVAGAVAEHVGSMVSGSPDAATTSAGSDAATSGRKKGTGWVVIDGEPRAQSQAPCSVVGARPGVDNGYKITEVEHSYYRGGGFTSRLDLDNPGASIPQVDGKWSGYQGGR